METLPFNNNTDEFSCATLGASSLICFFNFGIFYFGVPCFFTLWKISVLLHHLSQRWTAADMETGRMCLANKFQTLQDGNEVESNCLLD